MLVEEARVDGGPAQTARICVGRRVTGVANVALLLLFTLAAGCSSVSSAMEEDLQAPGMGGCSPGGIGAGQAGSAQTFTDRMTVDDPRAAVMDRARTYLGNAGVSVQMVSTGELHGTGGSGLNVRVIITADTPESSSAVICGSWTAPGLVGGEFSPDRQENQRRNPDTSAQRFMLEGLVKAMGKTGD